MISKKSWIILDNGEDEDEFIFPIIKSGNIKLFKNILCLFIISF